MDELDAQLIELAHQYLAVKAAEQAMILLQLKVRQA